MHPSMVILACFKRKPVLTLFPHSLFLQNNNNRKGRQETEMDRRVTKGNHYLPAAEGLEKEVEGSRPHHRCGHDAEQGDRQELLRAADLQGGM